jgi:uncharacterized repeat protein (TIGR01451 family)
MNLSLSARSRTLACASLLLLVLEAAAASGPAPEPRALSADMAITGLVASPSPTVPDGTNLTCTISYINNGPDTPGSTSVSIQVPANTTFVSAQVLGGSGWNVISQPPAGGTGNMIWRKGQPGSGAAPGETAQFEFVVAVAAGAANGLPINVTANAYTIDAGTADPVSANNSRSVTVNVSSSVPPLQADMAITALAASPSPGVMVGTNLTYTISHVNNGPDTPGSSSVSIQVPANTTFVSAQVLSGSGWNVISQPSAGGTGNMIWRKGQPGSGAAPGETAQFELVVNVNPAVPHYTNISGTANTYSLAPDTIDSVPGNNSMTTVRKAMVVADPYEPNNEPGDAGVLPLGTTPDLVYSGNTGEDADWYKFFVPPEDAGQVVKVNLRVTSPYPVPPPPTWRSDLDFDVLDATLNDLVLAFSASDNETVYIPNAASGWYYINLFYSTTQYADSARWARYSVTIETGTDAGFGIGYISGRVVDGSGSGIEHVWVQANTYPFDWNISFVTAATGPGGDFTVAASPGLHYLYFSGDPGMSPNNPEVNIVPEYYADKARRAEATPVNAAVGQTLNVGDITVEIGAIVSGQVTNQLGSPLQNASVWAADLAENYLSNVFTDATGHYTLKRVPAGGAKIRFSRGSYAREFYDDQPTFGTAMTLATASGVEITGCDAVLTPGGAISGTVTDVNGGGQQVNLVLYSVLDNTYFRATVTSAEGTGTYSFLNVKPGDYKIFAASTEGNFGSKWYGDATSFATAATVTVTEGATASDKNIVMGTRLGIYFNNDLNADVLWRHDTNGEIWVWSMSGAARLPDTYVGTVSDTNWEIRAVADFDGDVDPDLLWRNKVTGEVYLWVMQGTTTVAETYVATVDLAYDIESYGDYSADGKADLLWRDPVNGELWAWIMDGAAIADTIYVGTVDPAYAIKGSADFNGDGRCDLVWHHAATGDVWIWLVQEEGAPIEAFVASVPDLGYQIKAVADFGGDGRADLLWHHTTNGEVWIWTMNGAARTAEALVGSVPDTNYGIVSAGDYDGDLKADILWWNSANGDVWVWLMNGAVKLSEHLVGTVPDTGYRIIK